MQHWSPISNLRIFIYSHFPRRYVIIHTVPLPPFNSIQRPSREKRTALKRVSWPNLPRMPDVLLRAKLRKEILMRLQCTLYLCVSSRDLRANVNETGMLHEGMRGIRLSGRLLNRWIFCGLVNTQADKGGPPPPPPPPRRRRYSR